MSKPAEKIPLNQIFRLFLKMGATGFGGPVALISLLEKEVSHRLKWISLQKFNESYVFCKLLPGPVAFQMAVWLGYYVRGRIGGLIAGAGFLLPGFALILMISGFYGSISKTPGLSPLLDGMRSGALAIIAESIVRMFHPYWRCTQAWVFCLVGAITLFYFPLWEPIIIVCGGLALVFFHAQRTTLASLAPFPLLLLQLFWTHFKAGAFVFGTGLAIVPFLEHDVVSVHGWLTTPQFIDGIAFGQITPGPITITSAFIGHEAAGFSGALIALAGMYSPGLILILFVMPFLMRRLEGSRRLVSFQQGAIPMVIGCVFGAAIKLSMTTLTQPTSCLIFGALLMVSLCFRLPGWLLIPMGSGLAWLFR